MVKRRGEQARAEGIIFLLMGLLKLLFEELLKTKLELIFVLFLL